MGGSVIHSASAMLYSKGRASNVNLIFSVAVPDVDMLSMDK